MSTRSWLRVMCGVALVTGLVLPVSGQAPSAAAPAAPPAEAEKPSVEQQPEKLPLEQQQVAQKYRQLEAVLMRMAELTDDPQRAALLQKAVAQSREQLIGIQLENLVDLLKKDQLADALLGQGEARGDMAKLLELLLSEDRSQNLDDEKRQLQQWIRDIGNLIKDQQGLQGETAAGGEFKGLGERQGKLGDKTEKVSQQIAEAEEKKRAEEARQQGDSRAPGQQNPGEQTPSESPGEQEQSPNQGDPAEGDKPESKPTEGQPSPAESQQGEPSEGQPSEGQPSEGQPSEGQPSEGQPSEGQPSQGQPSQGQPSQGKPSEGQPSDQEQNPTQQRLQRARQRMQQAQERLKEADRNQAVEEQEEAIRELREAKAELERILQQLREEEMQRTLAMLEQRFRKMLAAQVDVYEATVRIDSVPEDRRTRNDEIDAGRQSRREAAIADDARRALELLKQDGTAVAFPEAVGQMIEDMDQATTWLGEAKVGEVTQALEQDIIAALEEMVAALEKAQQELEEGEQEPPQESPTGEPEDPPLVDQLAELKMIRALQMRVNRRTQFYGKLVEGEVGQTDKPELLDALNQLSEREERIFRTTRDIVTGRNQ